MKAISCPPLPTCFSPCGLMLNSLPDDALSILSAPSSVRRNEACVERGNSRAVSGTERDTRRPGSKRHGMGIARRHLGREALPQLHGC